MSLINKPGTNRPAKRARFEPRPKIVDSLRAYDFDHLSTADKIGLLCNLCEVLSMLSPEDCKRLFDTMQLIFNRGYDFDDLDPVDQDFLLDLPDDFYGAMLGNLCALEGNEPTILMPKTGPPMAAHLN